LLSIMMFQSRNPYYCVLHLQMPILRKVEKSLRLQRKTRGCEKEVLIYLTMAEKRTDVGDSLVVGDGKTNDGDKVLVDESKVVNKVLVDEIRWLMRSPWMKRRWLMRSSWMKGRWLMR